MQYGLKSYEPRAMSLWFIIDRFGIGHNSSKVLKWLFYKQSVRYVDKPRLACAVRGRGLLGRLQEWVIK